MLVASTALRRPHKDSDHTAMIAVAYMPKFTMLVKLLGKKDCSKNEGHKTEVLSIHVTTLNRTIL